MNVLITGDRSLFEQRPFMQRLEGGLKALGIAVDDIHQVVRTAYGGAELRAQEFAHRYGIPVHQIRIPVGYGKHARFAAMNSAVVHSDVAVIFQTETPCEHVEHAIKAAQNGEITYVLV